MIQVYFCNIPFLSTDYSAVVDFSSKSQRTEFFNSYVLYNHECNIKFDGERTSLTIKVPCETIINYDYCFYFDKNGNFILGKTSEKKQEEIRSIRNSYLRDTDKYIVADYPITGEERELYKAYRVYLRDYPKSSENWYESEPLTFEKWKEQEDKK